MTVVEPSPFGILLREFRANAGLTQEELAEEAGLSARVVSDLERGVSRLPRLHTVRQLAKALSLSSGEREQFTAAARGRTGTLHTESMTEPMDTANAQDERCADVRTFLIADIRGYTRFTQEFGDEAAAVLATRFANVMRSGVVARGGRLLELRGDEALCVFSSVRQAIRAAVELQTRFTEEAGSEPMHPLSVGMGLDAGEAVPVEGGYRGEALNLAARLTSLAAAGDILISESLAHLARKVEGLSYVERGLIELKGFAQPVRVVEVVPDVEPALSGSAGDESSFRNERERRLPIGGFLGAIPGGPIVAREDEVDRVLSALDTVHSGTGQLLLLAGEQGVGKTRLAQEVTLRLRDRGFLVVAGRCYQSHAATPFHPFREMLSELYRAASTSVRSRVAVNWPYLARLMPDELSVASREIDGTNEEEHRVFRAVAGLLTEVSGEVPLSLLLDDLHWADESSLELLQYVARETRVQRVLILGTYRDGNVERDGPFDRAFRSLSRERLVERAWSSAYQFGGSLSTERQR